MTFPNTWLNECLHSVKKKIDQWVRFGEECKKKKKKSDFHRDRNQSVQREKQEECMEKSLRENKGQLETTDTKCVCFYVSVY